jgi:hypothetical protein
MNNVAIRSTAVLLSLVGVIGAGCAQVRGPMYGPGHAGPRHTPGWSMMSEQERAQHHAQIRAAKTPEECQRIMDEHRRLMERRAAERGMPMQPPPEAACPAR